MKIEEIASLAGVSKSAVSLALNGKQGVSHATREKVLRIARDSGYYPKSLHGVEQIFGSSKVIRFIACTNFGIVSDEYQNQPFFMELFHNIEEQCRKYGLSLSYSSIRHDQFFDEIDNVGNNYVSKGIILLGTNLSMEEIEKLSAKNNIVIIDTLFNTLNFNFVVMNNIMGAHQAAKYLTDLGHLSIGYVQSSSRMYNFDSRKTGFFDSIKSLGRSIPTEHIFTVDPTITTSQSSFISQWSNIKGTTPTALFCECDYIAISVIKSLTEMGLNVPQNVSVMGFDNIRESTIIFPELTTIDVAKQDIAAYAVQALIPTTESTTTARIKVIVDTSLIERNSCCQLIKP